MYKFFSILIKGNYTYTVLYCPICTVLFCDVTNQFEIEVQTRITYDIDTAKTRYSYKVHRLNVKYYDNNSSYLIEEEESEKDKKKKRRRRRNSAKAPETGRLGPRSSVWCALV